MRQALTRVFALFLCVVILCSVCVVPVAAVNGEGTYAIHSVTMETGADTAYVQVTSESGSVLFVALYNSESRQMLGIGSSDISESVTRQEVPVTVSCARSNNAIVKAFLLDGTSFAPLCQDGTAGDSEGMPYYSVTFLRNDGSEGYYDLQMVEAGKRATRPNDPERELYGFTGWYTELETVAEYDFSEPISHNLFLYAGWGSPDGVEGLYTTSEGGGTEASITQIEMLDSSVIVTVNTDEQAVLYAEFIDEDTDTVLLTVFAETSDYCEMEPISIPVDIASIPEYYVVRAGLLNADDEELCSPFTTIRYTSAYAEFDAKTIDDFEGKTVVNFDESTDDNFGVLSDDVNVIPYVDGVNIVTSEYEPEYDEDGFVTEMVFLGYNVTNPDEWITGLSVGDIIMIYDSDGMPLLFAVGTVTSRDDGSVFLTEDESVDLTDCYEFIKVNMYEPDGGEDDASLMAELVDFDTEYMKLDFKPGIDYRPKSNPYFHIKVNGDVSIRGQLSVFWDAHLFRDDYFEFSHKVVKQAGLDFEVSVDNSYSEGSGQPLRSELFSIPIVPKKDIPTKVPGLKCSVEVKIPLTVTGKAKFGAHFDYKVTSGVVYNTDSGEQKIDKKEKSLNITVVEGSVEVRFGPEASVALTFLESKKEKDKDGNPKAWFRAQLKASAGASVKVSGALDIDVPVGESAHACLICLDLELKWYAEAKATLNLNVPKVEKLQGTIFDITILKLEGPLSLFGALEDGKAYCSIANSRDSVFQGKPFRLGAGSCPNKKYRTEFNVQDVNEQDLSGCVVSLRKEDGTEVATDTAPYTEYLYAGKYTVNTVIDGRTVSKTFTVDKAAQVIIITPNSADGGLTGSVINAATNAPVADVAVVVKQGNQEVAVAKTDSTGAFSIRLPSGNYNLIFSKGDYTTKSHYVNIKDGEIRNIQTVSLIYGKGNLANIPDNSIYYGNHAYKLYDAGVSWEIANLLCRMKGGHLVTITSQDEQTVIESLIRSSQKNGTWLGAYKLNNSLDYVWITGEDFVYSNWLRGQPDNENGIEDKLMLYNYNNYQFGGWNDLSNEGVKDAVYGNIAYICEWDNVKDDAIYFNGHAYKAYEQSMTWDDAKIFCESLGGHLATITSQEEQNHIENIISNGSKYQYWLGATDEETEGIWLWVTGEQWDYTNWDRNMPDNNRRVEHYLQIYNKPNPHVSGSARYKWNDITIDNIYTNEPDFFLTEYIGFVCEWDN